MRNTVLVVDDDSNLLDGLRRLLQREPYGLLTEMHRHLKEEKRSAHQESS
jgi:hypothetical protein